MIRSISAWAAFNDPSSPWYYVVGIIFLALIFAALGGYIVYAKKHKKPDDVAPDGKGTDTQDAKDTSTPDDGKNEKADAAEPAPTEAESSDGSTEQNSTTESADADTAADPNAAEKAAEDNKEETDVADGTTEQAAIGTDEPALTVNESSDAASEQSATGETAATEEDPKAPTKKTAAKPTAKKTSTARSTAAKTTTKTTAKPKTSAGNADKPAKQTAAKTATAKTATAKTAAKTPAAKSTQKKSADKAFVDRLIGAKSVHSVYNELKNTILSYPGVKAKLNKDGEEFRFGEDKKAALMLNGDVMELYLAVDPATVPEQLGATAADGELPTKLDVAEDRIDNAQKLIFFAMNVAMLTRNANRRYVDYVQNAISAKQRSAAKKK
mgnify:CR=1 FL=1